MIEFFNSKWINFQLYHDERKSYIRSDDDDDDDSSKQVEGGYGV